MQIQISTDKNVHGGEALIQRLEGEVESALTRFTGRLTRVEVHLSDEIAANAGGVDRRCVIEARSAGHGPLAVTHHAGSVAEASHGALRKLESVLDSTYGRAGHHKGADTIRHLEVMDEAHR